MFAFVPGIYSLFPGGQHHRFPLETQSPDPWSWEAGVHGPGLGNQNHAAISLAAIRVQRCAHEPSQGIKVKPEISLYVLGKCSSLCLGLLNRWEPVSAWIGETEGQEAPPSPAKRWAHARCPVSVCPMNGWMEEPANEKLESPSGKWWPLSSEWTLEFLFRL